MKLGKRYPLDYIQSIPSTCELPKSLSLHTSPKDLLRRELIFKNLVMNVIRDIRLQRQKPKLHEIVKILKALHKHDSNLDLKDMTREDKEKIIDKIKVIFGTSRDAVFLSKFKEDPKNAQIYGLYDRHKKAV